MDLKRRTVLGAIGSTGLGSLAVGQNAFGRQQPLPLMPSGTRTHTPVSSTILPQRMTGARAAVRALRAEGTPCVFGVPGAQNNEFWDAMKAAQLPYLLVAHESAASVMADASARVTGRVGVCSVIPGPGLTNALTGIGEALLDSSPIVALVTDVERGPQAYTTQVHGLSNTAILRTVCKGVIAVSHQGQIQAAIHQAFRLARSGPQGPVGVVIPYHLYSEVWNYDHPVPLELMPPWDESGYRAAVRLLCDRSHRVGIYAGLGCAEASGELQAVAELLQAPVATTVSGKGVISDHHPLAVGWGYGSFGTNAAERAFRRVDTVLAVGTRFSEVSTANYSIPQKAHLIHVDHDPGVLRANVPTSVAVHADAKLFLSRLIGDRQHIARAPDAKLVERIQVDRSLERSYHQQPVIKDAVDPKYFLTILGQVMGHEGLIFIDVTASTHWAAEVISRTAPRRYFTPADNQSMGWAVSAAIGGKRVRPDLPVACVTGDGCFLMSGLEASTAARARLPVKFFVLDDGAYHYMQMLQEQAYGRTTATELASLDYPSLSHGMGLSYLEITSNRAVPDTVSRAISHQGPMLVRVQISYEGREIRWLKSLRRTYFRKLDTGQRGRIISRRIIEGVDPIPEND